MISIEEVGPMIYMGIDPGKDGAFAIIDDEGRTTVHPFDRTEFIETCRALARLPVVCCLEQVHSMPKQGVSSTFNFGKTAGYLEGVLEAFGIAYQLVTPQKWKKEFSVTSDKNTSIAVCKRLFPEVSLRRTERSRKDDDGFAEALLMAEYARRHF